jgi:phosphatidylglycerophosphatase A
LRFFPISKIEYQLNLHFLATGRFFRPSLKKFKKVFTLMIDLIAKWIASGFGSGYANVAPGTFGSFAALFFWWLLFQIGALDAANAAVVPLVITTAVGFLAVAWCVRNLDAGADPQWIVIDEWAGLYIALLGLTPGSWGLVLAAFIFFRAFDALKTGPVAWAESLPKAFGIMADDLVAGIMAAIVIWGLRLAIY